ncbi:hypothetical protein GCM10022393_38400 [Aquimarina addita]|uniref:histidine kinase n=2 Tax=Aquimarina addita TaxID=870485 RepID=A0ABP6US79_9FLAO
MDGLSKMYELSKNKSLSIEERLGHINLFLDEVFLYRQDSLKYNGLMQKTLLLGRIRQYDSAIVYSYKLYNIAKLNKDTIYIKKALKKLGSYSKRNKELTEAFQYFNEAYKISRIRGDSIEAGENLLYMASIQETLGDFSGCKTTAIDGVKFLEGTSDLKPIFGLYHILSVAYREQKDYDEALKYVEIALHLATDSVPQRIKSLENTKANILADKKQYQEALTIISRLVSDPLIKNNKRRYARVLDNQGHIKWLNDKQNEKSLQLFLESLRIREDIGDSRGLIASNMHLTEYFFDRDKNQSLMYAENALQHAKSQQSLTSILEALGFILHLKENTKEEGILFKETYDELREMNRKNREVYAVTKYENDKLINENLILKAETAKKQQERVLYIALGIILILIIIFIVDFLRQKHKREKIKEVHNTEIRISKKLHDELGNDVYNIMMLLQASNQDVTLVDKLEDIYLRTRDISREYNRINTGYEYATEFSSMLNSYGSDSTRVIIRGLQDINWQSITSEKKIIVYRVLQELMINMRKHSHAQLVALTFKKTSKHLKINYSDNGVGVTIDSSFYSNGLHNVENRIKAIGGIFIFDSEKEKGFKAKIRFLN